MYESAERRAAEDESYRLPADGYIPKSIVAKEGEVDRNKWDTEGTATEEDGRKKYSRARKHRTQPARQVVPPREGTVEKGIQDFLQVWEAA